MQEKLVIYIAKAFCLSMGTNYYDYKLTKARRKIGDHQGFNLQLVLLSLATGSVFSGKLLAFDVIRSKAREIVGNEIRV